MVIENNTAPEITVFIVHWNRPEQFKKTIESYLAQTNCLLRFVIWDNGSSPENLKQLKAALPSGSQLFEGSENLGWGKAFNKMLSGWLEENSGHFCLISAHDALTMPSCIEILWTTMKADPQIGIASPDHSGQALMTTYSPLRGAKVKATDKDKVSSVEEIPYAHGTLFMVRKQCLSDIGLFDERFFAYGDEADLSLRARERHWKVVICHQAEITNPISGTAKPALFYLDARNSLLLAQKHGGRIKSFLRSLIVCTASLTRLLIGKDIDIEKAKLCGIRDYYLRRWGAPPANLKLLLKEPTALTSGVEHE